MGGFAAGYFSIVLGEPDPPLAVSALQVERPLRGRWQTRRGKAAEMGSFAAGCFSIVLGEPDPPLAAIFSGGTSSVSSLK